MFGLIKRWRARKVNVARSNEPQRRARQTDGAHGLAAQLLHAGKHMLDVGARLGDALVAPFLGCRDRFVLAPFVLDVHAPALFAQPLFAYIFKVQRVGSLALLTLI